MAPRTKRPRKASQATDIPSKPAKAARKTRSPTSTYNPAKHSLASLPYHVLLSILSYAAPTRDPRHHWNSAKFLLSTATLCRALYEPSIAALYYNPPLDILTRNHRLLQTLRSHPHLCLKVKVISLDTSLLYSRAHSLGNWDLCEFVRLVRGVKEISVLRMFGNKRWKYPDNLWDVLEGVGTGGDDGEGGDGAVAPVYLRKWTWSGECMDGLDMTKLTAIHSMRSFSTLKSLSLDEVPALDDGDLATKETEIPQLIGMLPNLTTLCFKHCPIVNDRFLTFLAEKAQQTKLESLTFVNCHELTGGSTGLDTFLTHPLCRGLKALGIDTCNKCSISFLGNLSYNTPHLQTLFFYGQHFAVHTSDNPLLPQPPNSATWPPTLTSITLWCLKGLTGESCSAFLESLLTAAPTLTSLREVRLWFISTLSWRARAEFREKWVPRLQPGFVGCCDGKVEFKFDGARPAEMIYSEEDFLEE